MKSRIFSNLHIPVLFISISILYGCSGSSSTNSNEEEDVVEVTGPAIESQEITYSNGNIQMKGYVAYDKNREGQRPGVLVVHEWWGHNEYARERADMLAELGYVALAVDMFGDGKVAEHPEDAGAFAGEVFSNIEEATSRFIAAFETLQENEMVDKTRIGAIGYCFGGSVVLTMANSGLELDAVAAFHAGLNLPIPPSASNLKARILVCNGADDPFVPQEQTDAWKAAMDSTGVDYTYVSYPGVVHSFTSKYADANGEKFELPLKYDEEADTKSWEEMNNLFAEVWK